MPGPSLPSIVSTYFSPNEPSIDADPLKVVKNPSFKAGPSQTRSPERVVTVMPEGETSQPLLSPNNVKFIKRQPKPYKKNLFLTKCCCNKRVLSASRILSQAETSFKRVCRVTPVTRAVSKLSYINQLYYFSHLFGIDTFASDITTPTRSRGSGTLSIDLTVAKVLKAEENERKKIRQEKKKQKLQQEQQEKQEQRQREKKRKVKERKDLKHLKREQENELQKLHDIFEELKLQQQQQYNQHLQYQAETHRQQLEQHHQQYNQQQQQQQPLQQQQQQQPLQQQQQQQQKPFICVMCCPCCKCCGVSNYIVLILFIIFKLKILPLKLNSA